MESFKNNVLGIEEISKKDAQKVNGGIFWEWVFGVMVGGLIYDLISNPSQSIAKIDEGTQYGLSLYNIQ
ncbi:MAG: hypothetical protein K6A62_01270 [Bacteroidales bacterium]|nr:hypothetical protein [Bacteroidales bacterium]